MQQQLHFMQKCTRNLPNRISQQLDLKHFTCVYLEPTANRLYSLYQDKRTFIYTCTRKLYIIYSNSGRNLAYLQSTSQSNRYPSSASSLAAVDGSGTTCTRTTYGPEQWWRVDFDTTVHVHSIQLSTRLYGQGYNCSKTA